MAVLILMVTSLPLAWVSPHTVVAVQHPGTFDDHWVLDAVYKTTHGIFFGRDVAFLYGPLAHWLMGVPPRVAGFSLGAIYTSYRTLLLWCAILFSYFALRLLIPEQAAWKRFLLVLLLGVFWTSWDGRTAFGIFLFVLFLRGWYAVQEGPEEDLDQHIPRGLEPARDDKAEGLGRDAEAPLYPNNAQTRVFQKPVKPRPLNTASLGFCLQPLNPLLFGCGAALLTAVAFWYSADTGVYGVAAWLIAMGGVGWESRRDLRKNVGTYVLAIAAFAASSVVLVFVINTIIASPLDFRFWRTSLALVSVHRWNEPAPMSEAGAIHLLAPLLIGAALFFFRLTVPADRKVLSARHGFLLSAFVFAALSMQSGLVRSDPNHIVFGVFPMVFFTGAILFSFPSRIGSAAAALAAIAASLLFSEPAPIFQPSYMRYRLARMHTPITTCPAGYREFDGVCYPREFAEELQATVDYLQQHSGEHDAVAIFPYQYMFGVAARRDVAGSVEQSFLANGAYLSQFDIAGLERAKAPVGLYFPDAGPRELASPILSLPIDDVSNFTRTPDVWLWMFRHYRLDQEVAPGIFGLQRDDSRKATIVMQEQPLTLAARSYPVQGSTATIDLGAPEWPTGGADFLRLRLKVRYSPLWKLRKPERLQLEIARADGSSALRTFVVEPNVASEVWFYPWDEKDLVRFFSGDENQWRVGARPAIVGLRLLVTPLDWFSERPGLVVIEAAEAVRFGMAK